MKQLVPALIASVIVTNLGCGGSPDERLIQATLEAQKQQADQNLAHAELAKSAAETQRKTLESVEKSRQQLAGVQQDIQGQRDKLDLERQQIATDRRRESLIAPVLAQGLAVLAALLPLALAWRLLTRSQESAPDEIAVTEVLLQELAAQPQSRLAGPATQALPDPLHELPAIAANEPPPF